MKSLAIGFSALALAATTALAGEKHDHSHDEARHADAHVHGHGTLNIALEGNDLEIELIAPGADIVGFEHAAETEEDKAAIEAATARLENPLDLFVMPAAAGCALEEAEVELENEGDEGHNEFHAHYHIECDDPSAISSITFAWFETFPGSEELDVNLISDKGQTSFSVERDDVVKDLSGQV